MKPERLRELATGAVLGSGFLTEETQEVAYALFAYADLLKAQATPEATGIYDSAWVIEGMWSSAAYPEYWVGSSAWSSDPYKALRFASTQTAQQAADMMLVGINHRVACHEFFMEHQQ